MKGKGVVRDDLPSHLLFDGIRQTQARPCWRVPGTARTDSDPTQADDRSILSPL